MLSFIFHANPNLCRKWYKDSNCDAFVFSSKFFFVCVCVIGVYHENFRLIKAFISQKVEFDVFVLFCFVFVVGFFCCFFFFAFIFFWLSVRSTFTLFHISLLKSCIMHNANAIQFIESLKSIVRHRVLDLNWNRYGKKILRLFRIFHSWRITS